MKGDGGPAGTVSLERAMAVDGCVPGMVFALSVINGLLVGRVNVMTAQEVDDGPGIGMVYVMTSGAADGASVAVTRLELLVETEPTDDISIEGVKLLERLPYSVIVSVTIVSVMRGADIDGAMPDIEKGPGPLGGVPRVAGVMAVDVVTWLRGVPMVRV